MRFDFVIGNPPYQDEAVGDNKNFNSPIYNLFLDASYTCADKVEMIHPARFLFNAGGTPKAWNTKMLNDPHFKIETYERDSTKVFANTDIKGGVCVSYYDKDKDFGKIGIFLPDPEHMSIYHKVCDTDFVSFNTIINSPVIYKISETLYKERPEDKEKLSKGNEYDIRTNVFKLLDDVFVESIPSDADPKDYLKIYGCKKNIRVERYVLRKFINDEPLAGKYKVLISEANGKGELGEALAPPFIGEPDSISTQSFVPIGACDTREEAESILKYIKSKFARLMLGVMKVTQHASISTWGKVPLQDFSSSSDIDWTQSVHNIDQQLYKKYGLTDEEQAFIESHVKEMN